MESGRAIAVPAGNPSGPAGARDWIIACGERYWPGAQGAAHLAALPQPSVRWTATRNCQLVELPPWARRAAPNGASGLLVDRSAIAEGPGSPFERCNWFAAAFLFLTGAQEGIYSQNSYSGSTGVGDPRLFERAWVNRHMLLLRKLAARHAARPEEELFGFVPGFEIDLTHDVDAVRKTAEIRLKQSAFIGFNAARRALSGDWREAAKKASHATRFLATTPSYRMIEHMRRMEMDAGVRSTFHIYGGPPGLQRRSPMRMLLDPAYDAAAPELRDEWCKLLDGGWHIGVHPSFHSSEDAGTIRREKDKAAEACGQAVTRCRQHWLRFSWDRTWRAQSDAGLALDTTLGFNDRPAFRNGAALRFHPWDMATGAPLPIVALPMIFMDSHFYDYQTIDAGERRQAIRYWIDEMREVGGAGSLNWHPHTLCDDYGWGGGFHDLLDLVA